MHVHTGYLLDRISSTLLLGDSTYLVADAPAD